MTVSAAVEHTAEVEDGTTLLVGEQNTAAPSVASSGFFRRRGLAAALLLLGVGAASLAVAGTLRRHGEVTSKAAATASAGAATGSIELWGGAGGCQCDCGWASAPNACAPMANDGHCCWSSCCGGSMMGHGDAYHGVRPMPAVYEPYHVHHVYHMHGVGINWVWLWWLLLFLILCVLACAGLYLYFKPPK